MSERQKRYLLFADILGTRSLYKARNSALIERKRTALGLSIRTAVYPYIDSTNVNGVQINLFSDTALVASPNLPVLIDCAARLFYVFSLRTAEATTTNELCLLRGGIAHGEALVSNSLTTSAHVDVAGIFDTSLTLAFDLETLRKGSRLFLCADTYVEATKDSTDGFHRWQAVTGIGAPVSPAFEFYWPTFLFKIDGEFRTYFDMLCSVWYRLFTAKTNGWEIPEYDSALYQLDESIKLCIRAAAFAPQSQAQSIWDLLTGYLPTSRPELIALDCRFTWGTWFQILWVLLLMRERHSFLASEEFLGDLITRNLRIVDTLKHLASFRQELENPDYAWFRVKLSQLKLL